MEKCIAGHLKGKTRIVVTHAISYLSWFDQIIILEDGKIVRDGTFDEISGTREYYEFKDEIFQEEVAKSEAKSRKMSTKDLIEQIEDTERIQKKFSVQNVTSMETKTMKKQLSLVNSRNSEGDKVEEPGSPSRIGDQQILANNLVGQDKLLAMSDVHNNDSMVQEDDNLIQRKAQNDENKEDKMAARTLIKQKTLEDKKKEDDKSLQKNASKTDKIISNVLKEEDRAVGNVSFATKMAFFNMMGGIHFVFLDFLFLVGIQILNFVQQYKMQSWASKDEDDRVISTFLWIIVGFTMAAYALTICRQALS